MRDRAAYTTFEQTVISLYDKGILTLDLLDALAEAYRGTHIDCAGSRDLTSRDGKDLQQVSIALVDPSFVLVARGSRDDNEEYWERELQLWSRITGTRWGWCSPCHRDHRVV